MEPTTNQPILLRLELVPDNPHDADPAFLYAVGQETTRLLTEQGCTITPVYTGQRGGELLIDISTELGTFLAHAWAQKDLLLAEGGNLASILSLALMVVQSVRQTFEKRSGQHNARQDTIKFTLEVDGRITIDLPQDAPNRAQIVQELLAQHPELAKKTTSPHQAQLRGHLSKKQQRKHR